MLTYWEFTHVPDRLHSATGQGLSAGERAAARLRLRASAQRSDGSHREAGPRHAEGVAHTVGISGQSLILNANAPNFGSMYVMLKEFRRTPRPAPPTPSPPSCASAAGSEMREAMVSIFGAPPVDGLGTTGGFKLMVEDRGNSVWTQLQNVSDQIVARGNATPGLEGLFNSSRADTPWLYLDIDRTKCMAMGVPLDDVFNTFRSIWARTTSTTSTSSAAPGRSTFRPMPASATESKTSGNCKCATRTGQMVPLGTLMTVRDTSGPVMLMRYNMYSAAAINGNTSPGTSSGQAIDLMREIADKEVAARMAYDWTELTYMQLRPATRQCTCSRWPWCSCSWCWRHSTRAGSCRWPSSWSCRCACSARSSAWLIAGMDVNIFTQIGFVVLVGLASKNAILIVEFAKQQRESGVPRREATLEACRLRLAADHDDLVRLHSRRGAAGDRRGGGGGDASLAGHGRLQPACWASRCSASSSRRCSSTSSSGSAADRQKRRCRQPFRRNQKTDLPVRLVRKPESR